VKKLTKFFKKMDNKKDPLDPWGFENEKTPAANSNQNPTPVNVNSKTTPPAVENKNPAPAINSNSTPAKKNLAQNAQTAPQPNLQTPPAVGNQNPAAATNPNQNPTAPGVPNLPNLNLGGQTFTPPQNKKPSIFARFFKFLFGLIFDVVTVFAIVVVLRMFIISPFQVKGHSMDETLAENDFILVDQISYRFSAPARGDIVVFRPPSNRLYQQTGLLCEIYKAKARLFGEDETKACFVPEYFVKRIIGTPGDKVQVFNGKVFVTPARETEKIEIDESFLAPQNRGQTCIG
jgi:signal peptidase I